MQRTRILVLKQDQDRVVALLQEAWSSTLEQTDKGSFFREAVPPDYAVAVADEAFRLEGLATALSRVPVSERLEVGNVDDVLAKSKEIQIDEDVRKLKVELENVDVMLNRNNSYLESLGKIAGFDKDLGALAIQSLIVGFYSISVDQFDDFVSAVRALSNEAVVESYSFYQRQRYRSAGASKASSGFFTCSARKV